MGLGPLFGARGRLQIKSGATDPGAGVGCCSRRDTRGKRGYDGDGGADMRWWERGWRVVWGLWCCERGWVWAPDQVWGDGREAGAGVGVGGGGAGHGEIPAASAGMTVMEARVWRKWGQRWRGV